MCNGIYEKDSEFAKNHNKMRFVRGKAVYFLRGRYRRISGKDCVYCGFKSDTGDHVPPLLEGFLNGVVKGVVVSACFDCNRLLGSFSSTCLKERAAFLAKAYRREIDSMPETNDYQIEDIALLQKIAAIELKADRCTERINAVNCDMIRGSAALFRQNGQCGGESVSFEQPFC